MILGLIVVGVVFGYMNTFYLLSRIQKDYSVVDIGWGLGFVLIGVLSLVLAPELTVRGIIGALLVSIWAIRLSGHVFLRNKGKPEDFRYQKMRENWGSQEGVISYFRIFLLQGFLMLCIGYPLILINVFPRPGFTILDGIGIFIWVIGFGFETIGDYQLNRFIAEQKDSSDDIMTDGLWRYTRHPNYFGESLLWWGIFVITFSAPYGWSAFMSPVVITYLLLFVSGVPLLEERYSDNEAYQKYAKKTNKFIPWFPQSKDNH